MVTGFLICTHVFALKATPKSMSVRRACMLQCEHVETGTTWEIQGKLCSTIKYEHAEKIYLTDKTFQ
jgi:hypothetical protein